MAKHRGHLLLYNQTAKRLKTAIVGSRTPSQPTCRIRATTDRGAARLVVTQGVG
jgi:hypothetical protein